MAFVKSFAGRMPDLLRKRSRKPSTSLGPGGSPMDRGSSQGFSSFGEGHAMTPHIDTRSEFKGSLGQAISHDKRPFAIPYNSKSEIQDSIGKS
jgi:hypothetical protein